MLCQLEAQMGAQSRAVAPSELVIGSGAVADQAEDICEASRDRAGLSALLKRWRFGKSPCAIKAGVDPHEVTAWTEFAPREMVNFDSQARWASLNDFGCTGSTPESPWRRDELQATCQHNDNYDPQRLY